jgi:hypothetical protein
MVRRTSGRNQDFLFSKSHAKTLPATLRVAMRAAARDAKTDFKQKETEDRLLPADGFGLLSICHLSFVICHALRLCSLC